ncbi:hypothetical protein P4E94_13505 [Pontiellaceae bacterium B12219]|nr:hypothetical protein [Pontiellaceae bacterium B12219]
MTQILSCSNRDNILDKAALVQRGLEVLIAQERKQRRAAIGETEKNLKPMPRRKNIT